jgi:protein-S-isoprenylcysteine O-methyltransferase Ste14
MAIKLVIFQLYCIISLYLLTVIGRRKLDKGKGFTYALRLARIVHPIYAFGWIGFLLTTIIIIPLHPQPLLPFARLLLPRQVAFTIYLFLFILSGIVGLPGIAGLASRKVGSLRLMTEKFISSGIRTYVRNPMSLAGYLFLIGYAVAFSSGYLLVVSLFGIIPAHAFYLRIYEEKELELKFGDEYLAYRRKVPFLIPRIRQRKS